MPRRSKVPCVVTVHDLTFFDHAEWHEPSKVAWFRAAMRYSVGHAAVIICVSEITAGRLRDVLSPRCPVVVVPHGVDQACFVADEPSPGADGEVLERLGLHRPYLLHLGPWSRVRASRTSSLLSTGSPAIDQSSSSSWPAAPAGRPAPSCQSVGRRVHASGSPARLCARRRCSGTSPAGACVALPVARGGFRSPALEALACGNTSRHDSGTSMPSLPATAPCSSRQVSRTRSRRQSRRRSPSTLPVS